MFRFAPVSFAAILILAVASVATGAPSARTESPATPAPGKAEPALEKAPAEQTGEFRFGPITSRDPEVRAQVKKLYLDQADLATATQTRLDALVVSLAAETDSDLRLQIQKEMIAAKKDLQIKTMELGLQIARLNQDDVRVADYEKALDLLLHPEKALPATLDPSIAKERAARLGHE